MESDYEVEKVYKIWDNKTGDHIYVGPDGDGLDMIELREVTKNGEIVKRFTLTKGQFAMILEIGDDLLAAIIKYKAK